MAEPAKGLRFPRYTLRTLFVVITVFCVLVGWGGYSWKWIQQRHKYVSRMIGPGYGPSDWVLDGREQAPAPWPLRLFGERGYSHILIKLADVDGPRQLTDEEKEEISHVKSLFPEADHVEGVIMWRDKSSSCAVRLVDTKGRPVPDAEVWLGFDWESDKIIGPAKSDAAGVARLSEGREVLPIFTVFAETEKGQLKGSANLDRGLFYGRGFKDIQPITIEMKRVESSN